MSKFAVLAERCDQCLFGPNKIVSNERRADILQTIRRQDSYFVCHKASIAGVVAACRGDYDQNGCGQIGRIMGRPGAVRFVTETDLHKLPPDRERERDEDGDDA